MVNLFSFADNDQSLIYLAKIFGYMNNIIPVSGVGTVVSTDASGMPSVMSGVVSGAMGTSITLLGTMFKTFNSAILAVAVLVVVYTMVVGIMATAHEGEFMGKKWHSLWVPIRMVFGIACLVPTTTGYCILQMIMMWVIVQGIGAADTLWTTVLNYVDIAGSPYAQVSLPSLQYQSTLNQLFQGLVCQSTASIYIGRKGNADGGGYYCNDPDNRTSMFCLMTTTAITTSGAINPNATRYYSYDGPGTVRPSSKSSLPLTLPLGPNGDCGILTYCNDSTAAACKTSDSLSCTSCKAEQQALSEIFPLLQGIAAMYVQADTNYLNFAKQSEASLPRTLSTTSASGTVMTVTMPPYMPTPAVPPQVQAYCTAHGIDPCQRDYKGSSGLPDPGIGTGSARRNAVTGLYWTYYIAPQLGDTTDFMGIATKKMSDALDGLFADFNKKMEDALKNGGSQLSGDLADAQSEGWITAGSYYYTIAKMNQNNLKDAMPVLSISFGNNDNMSPSGTDGNVMYNYRNSYSGAGSLIGAAGGMGDATMGGSSPSSVEEISQLSSNVTASVSATTQGSLSGDSNPLVQAQTAGYALLMIVQIAYPLFLAIMFALSLAGNFSGFVLGTGIINPIGPALLSAYLLIVPTILALFGILMTIGATLSVYLPLVPFVIFTFGAIGWLTSTIETMVAGPLVALGVIAPGGHHEILGKAEPALMLLFNVFLRPSLMIFGLVAAMLLASVVVGMINGAFWRVMTSISGGGSSGTAAVVFSPLTMVFFLVAYMSLVVSALNKCFAAIHIIPEKVMRWIGGQGEQYGEESAMGDMKQAVGGAASKAGQAATSAGGVPKQAGDQKVKGKQAEVQDKRQQEKDEREKLKGKE